MKKRIKRENPHSCSIIEARHPIVVVYFRWQDVDDADKPTNLQDTLGSIHPDFYPSIYMVLCVLISMPVSTATAERSFSVMRRVKTYLRNTMTTNRLSGLGLLNVYREKELSSDVVLDIFNRRKKRKLALIFQ